MTVPFMVMLSESETSQRFFGTCVPQNDRKENRHAAKAGFLPWLRHLKAEAPLASGRMLPEAG